MPNSFPGIFQTILPHIQLWLQLHGDQIFYTCSTFSKFSDISFSPGGSPEKNVGGKTAGWG